MEFDDLLEQVDLGELDVFESCIDEQQDMLEKLLGVILVPKVDTLNKLGMAPCDGCGELCLEMDSCQWPSPLFHFWV